MDGGAGATNDILISYVGNKILKKRRETSIGFSDQDVAYNVAECLSESTGICKDMMCNFLASSEHCEASPKIKKKTKQNFVINKCPHTDRKYYAKGLCTNCYHLMGRPNTATKCIHKNKMSFAKGLC